MVPAPNGFFLHGMLWYDLPRGDAVLVKGFRVDTLDVSGASVALINAQHAAISNFLYNLPDNVRGQSQWRVTSDYRDALKPYDEVTERDADNDWTVFARAEKSARLHSQMERDFLRREEHIIWLSKHIETPIASILRTRKTVNRHLNVLLEREAGAFSNLGMSLQQSLGSFAAITALDDHDNFIQTRNFLNPSLLFQDKESARTEFDAAASIQDLVFRSDGVRIEDENASFHFAGHYHSMFVISRMPGRVRPLATMGMTRLPFNDYVITTNFIAKNTREEIAKEEKQIHRLAGDMVSEHKHSLGTAKKRKETKVEALAEGYMRLFGALQVIRVWDKTLEGLTTKCEAIKAAISDLGAQYYHQTRATTARNLFFQTWPGNTFTNYRGYDIELSHQALACVLPFSSTFTGILEGAEALFHGDNRTVVGMRTFAGSTPQHMFVMGGTGAGKSVAMNALLAETEPYYTYTYIIEEGFTYATYTATLGATPIVLQLDGELTLNYLDTNSLPLSSYHIGTAAALCLKMVGYSDNEDTNKQRVAIFGEYLNQLYFDASEDWMAQYPSRIDELQRFGYAVEQFRLHHQPAATTFTDAYLAFREALSEHPEDSDRFLQSFTQEDIIEWAKTRDGGQTVRNLIFTQWEHADYENLTHHSLYTALRHGKMVHHNAEVIDYLANMLGTWTRAIGQRGKFFDGVSNISLESKVLHFELSLIPEAARDFKEAAGFLVNNVIRHLIMTAPRKLRKRIIFEEAPRFFAVAGGEEIISAAYATYRKYGAWLVTISQQLSQIPANLRPILIGNSQIKMIFRQKSSTDLDMLQYELKLPPITVDAIRNYPSPEHLPAHDRYSVFCYWTEHMGQQINGSVRIYASPEMLYVAASDSNMVDERAEALSHYENVLDGIINEVATRGTSNSNTPKPRPNPFMKKVSQLAVRASAFLLIGTICCGNMACSASGVRKGTTYAAGAAGGGLLAHELSDGDPLITAAGTVAGIGLAAVGNHFGDKEAITAEEKGYHRGQGDATKQHYWMLQSMEHAKAREYGIENSYELTIPAAEDVHGVQTVARRATVRLVE
jgi:hypothetical protein